MAKFKNLLTSLFPKSNSKLETDAAVIRKRSNGDEDDKDEDQNMTNPITTTGGSEQTNATPAVSSNAIVPRAPDEQLQPVIPEPGAITQNFISNVQNNALAAPQTSISNATGVQVYQIKNAKNVHIGNSFTFNSANAEEERRRPSTSSGQVKWANLKLSETIKQMMESEEELDTEMMITVSRHLGYEWKNFARSLEYSEGQIEAFECDNETLTERIYQFVLDWSRNDDEPSLGKLVKLLWDQKHKETVYHMKVLWKKKRHNTSE